jgi:hypothetical protein
MESYDDGLWQQAFSPRGDITSAANRHDHAKIEGGRWLHSSWKTICSTPRRDDGGSVGTVTSEPLTVDHSMM